MILPDATLRRHLQPLLYVALLLVSSLLTTCAVYVQPLEYLINTLLIRVSRILMHL
jgi:hypothetical protein